jgi:hypothetical protein
MSSLLIVQLNLWLVRYQVVAPNASSFSVLKDAELYTVSTFMLFSEYSNRIP